MPRAGRAAAGHFARSEGGISLDGDVVTGLIGADFEQRALLAGLAVSHSLGGGHVRRSEGRDSAEASLTSVYPYVRYAARDQGSAWAILGYGQGEKVRLRGPGARPLATDIDMKLGALGARGQLLSAVETGFYDVVFRSDAFWVQMHADGREVLPEENVAAIRLRFAMEGSRELPILTGGVLRQSAELARRHDGGGAQEGSGLELGGRLRYTDRDRGFALEAVGRGLLVHEDSRYRDWGVGRCVPVRSLRFLPSRVRPVDADCTVVGVRVTAGRNVVVAASRAKRGSGGEAAGPQGRIDAELRYGMEALGHWGLFTPYAAFSVTDRHTRTLRIGGRLRFHHSRLALAVEGAHLEYVDRTSEQRLLLSFVVY